MTSSGYLRGVILSLCLLVTALALVSCGQELQRQPEIPVNQFLQKQLEAFPPGWTLGQPDIWTDTDFTWARWAVAVNFNYKRGLQFAGEEIHVFVNSSAAQVITHPSPPSLSAGKGYIPKGWTYRPPHADQFEFGCGEGDGVSQPKGCSLNLRYEEYVIVFSTPIADYMTLKDLQRVLEVIDQEMSNFLGNSTLRLGPREVPTSLDE